MREEIARVVPFYDGLQHLKQIGDSFQYGGRHLCHDWKFPTPDGKAHFRAVPLPSRATSVAFNGQAPREANSFVVSTRRGKQFNSLVYAQVDPINGAPREAVLMNPNDAAELSLKQNDPVALINGLGRFVGRVFLSPIARGNLQVHWPEGNVIIRRGITDAAGGVPDFNARVRVEKLADRSPSRPAAPTPSLHY
jgi:anaerobic selenocysteine-containing dehydrogenase